MGSGASKTPKPIDSLNATVYAGAKFKSSAAHLHNTVDNPQEDRRPKSSRARPKSSLGDNIRKQSEAPVLSLIESFKADSAGIGHILHGNPSYGYESKPKIVRIFTSSTFTDTYHERNQLMERVFPKLKDFCQQFGYEFQVVDMRWGVREDAENDHTATELCLKELEACQKLSTGPNFVSFLSHKYGYRPFPRVIEADEFDLLTDEVTEEEEALIDEWFLLDENTLPAMYVLQPISKHFPDILSEDRKLHKKAKDAWWEVFLKLQNTLVRGATENLTDPKKRHNYLMSVTEREIAAGILNAKDTEKHCLWFRRIFDDIDTVEHNRELSRYYEFKASDALSVQEVKSQIHQLRDVQLPTKLSSKNVYPYHIKWKSPGVNPQEAQHSTYLDRLCEDFLCSLKDLIRRGIQQDQLDEGPDQVVTEILEHSSFRHQTCQLFSGRNQLLEEMERYVCGTSTEPLILVGGSGSGKTSVMAKAAELAWKWMDHRGAIVCRFLGTTKLSSSIKPLLKTLNHQLQLLYGRTSSLKYSTSEDMKVLMLGFTKFVKRASRDKPLLLVLDSLDNIDTADGGRQLEWLPRKLPSHVKVILSMRPEEKYGVFPRCRTIFARETCYRVITEMELSEVEEVIDSFLLNHKRDLTPLQRRVLLEGYKVSSSPLYLKLALDESLRWHSFDPPEVTRLYGSVPSMISAFFQRIEKQHGKTLVSFALAYFTAAQNGLSESEMEDLLSLNDTVLSDVYQYWVPPVRRLPPLLWVRIKTDLDPYLGKREEEGIQAIFWHYREFVQVACVRYLNNKTSLHICHQSFYEYYWGIWADKPKPYKEGGEVKSALRYVAKQPLRFDNGQFNLRKVNQLPFHLIMAKNLDVLKKEVFCNYEFLMAKITAVGVSAVLRDLKVAQMTFRKDEDIAIILEALQLSQNAIEHSPKELAGQLIGRLHINLSTNQHILRKAKQMVEAEELEQGSVAMVKTLMEMLEKLVDIQNKKYDNLLGLISQARNSREDVLVPHTACLVKPGGQLLHKLSGHHEKINCMHITSSGSILFTGSDDNTIKIWDIPSGEILVSCQVNSDVLYLDLFPDDSTLVASTVLGTVYVIDVSMGTIVMERDSIGGNHTNLPLAVCEIPKAKSTVIVVLTEKELIILNDKSLTFHGSCSHQLELEDHQAGTSLLMLGHKNHAIYASHSSTSIFVMTLTDIKKPAVRKCGVFNPPEKDSKHKSVISCMTVIPKSDQVAVCSGHTQDIHFVDLNSGKVNRRIQGHKNDKILDLYLSKAEDVLYFTAGSEVGSLELKHGDRKVQFPHPCKVRNVVNCGLQFVVTLGEDNILRIWDKMMATFAPDVSMFTGKVTVHSKSSMDTFKSILDTFSHEFEQDLEDTRGMLTTEDVPNYWTQSGDDLQHQQQEEITTRFCLVPNNKRHLVVTQNGTDPDNSSKRFTQCLTIWDLKRLQCVRRFFPLWHSMFVQGVVSSKAVLFTDLGEEGSPLYLLDITGDTFKPVMVYEGPFNVKLGCKLTIIPGTNYAVGEACSGDLTMYNLAKGEVLGILKPKTLPSANRRRYQNITVLSSSGHLLAIHSQRYLCKWAIDSQSLVWEVDLCSHLMGLATSAENDGVTILTFQWTPDAKFIVVQVDLPKSAEQEKVAKSVGVFDMASGKYLSSLNATASKDHVYKLPLLRRCETKAIQTIGLSSNGTAHLLNETTAQKHTNRLLVAENGSRCATWCAEGRANKVSYFGLDDDSPRPLGSFTLDEQLHDLYLESSGQSMVVSTATGLVRLQMSGRDVPDDKPEHSMEPVMYENTELNVKLEVSPDD